jgi:hypothetical protein
MENLQFVHIWPVRQEAGEPLLLMSASRVNDCDSKLTNILWPRQHNI